MLVIEAAGGTNSRTGIAEFMKTRLSVASLFLIAIIIPNTALAASYIVPGTTTASEYHYTEWKADSKLMLSTIQDMSYSCRSLPYAPGDSVQFQAATEGYYSHVQHPITLIGSAVGNRNDKGSFAFIAPSSEPYLFSVEQGTGSGPGGVAKALMQCNQTTIFGNFNTVAAANNVNFLEVTNITPVTIKILIILNAASGAELHRFSRSIKPKERQDIGIHDLPNAKNTFGSIVLSHDGPNGGIMGNVSKYQFDGISMNITATEPLRPQDQS